jgi:hypothetical protein
MLDPEVAAYLLIQGAIELQSLGIDTDEIIKRGEEDRK